MPSSNENINPRSLPNLSNLLTHSAQKRPKSQSHTGLKASSLHNVAFNDVQDHQEKQKQPPAPSCSWSSELTRLPISPPPEEELRVMELNAHAQSPRISQPQSHIPIRSRPGVFKLPGQPQSFANFQQQHHSQETSPAEAVFSSSGSNPRKRARSFFPSIPNSNSLKSLPSEAKPAAAHSPNPKPRKQIKAHESGVYDGSGFKRRHTHETSIEEKVEFSAAKSPLRKKRRDPGLQDYTPQRERKNTPATLKRTTRGPRSVTPDVRYEAPSEQFTPPRSVVLNVPSSATSVRSRSVKPFSTNGGGTRASVERKVLMVKIERFTSPFPLPPVDLSKPVPPPSPTDDPLLLIGIEEPPRRCATSVSNRTLVDAAVGAGPDNDKPPSTPVCYRSSSVIREMDQSHWNFASKDFQQTALMDVEFDGPSNFEATFNPELDSDDDDNDQAADPDGGVFTQPVAQFDPNESTGSHIFHSDDVESQVGEDEGEFTGRFMFYNTPLKQDPPSSATRTRRESWGRPISPFPFSLRASALKEDEELHYVAKNYSPPASPSPSEGRRIAITPIRSGYTLSEMEVILEAKTSKQDMPAESPLDDNSFQLSAIENPNKERPIGKQDVATDNFEDNDGFETEVCKDDDEAATVEREITPFDDLQDNNDNQGESSVEAQSHQQEPLASPEMYKDSQSSVDEENFLRDSSFSHKPALFTDFVVTVADGESRASHVYNNDDSSDEDLLHSGVVEVSSSDPRAAARAAAILKLHHAYIVDGNIAKRARRHSAHGFSRYASLNTGEAEASTEDNIRHAQRKTLSSNGGVLQFQPRHSAHSPLSQTTFLAPQSPAVSAVEALEEAETNIRAKSASPMRIGTPTRLISFQTEIATPLSIEMNCQQSQEGQQLAAEWTKDHWKMLDISFTDERIAVGEAMGLGGQMAPVDDVTLDAIVERFLKESGGGTTWDRQTLLRRAEALSTRQRAGRGAPPSPGEKVIQANTPVSRNLVPPVEVDAPTKLPPTLLAPRYAHLLEEAKTIKTNTPSTTVESITVSPTAVSEDQTESVVSQPIALATLVPMSAYDESDSNAVPASATKKVLNYLGSFLGRGGDNVLPQQPTLRPSFSTVLPMPLPEMRQFPRGPVNTPAKKPLPKSQAPRELVHLTEVQPLPKQVVFPKAKSVREMVALNHVDPPRSVQRPRAISGPIVSPGRVRRDSGSSVKDLVKSFEEVSHKTEAEILKAKSRPMIRKLASVGNLGSRPVWKP